MAKLRKPKKKKKKGPCFRTPLYLRNARAALPKMGEEELIDGYLELVKDKQFCDRNDMICGSIQKAQLMRQFKKYLGYKGWCKALDILYDREQQRRIKMFSIASG